MILIFFGPPGAGKGTQANLISRKLSLPHLSTGEIFRKKLTDNDSLSKKIKSILDHGELVSDKITNQVVSERIDNSDCLKGFILDGYPRTIMQAKFLKEKLEEKKFIISKIFDIEIDNKTIIERIKSRSNIENRQDDSQEVVKTRISKYFAETRPLADYYRNHYQNDYHMVNGNQDIKKINEDILNLLKNSDL